MKVKLACGHEVSVAPQTAKELKQGKVAVWCEQCMLRALDEIQKEREIKKEDSK